MNSIEALADCIMKFEGWSQPASILGGVKGTTSWRNRNPGNLRDSPYKKGIDDKGYAIFDSLTDGWDALTFDLRAKFTYPNRHNLTGASTLTDLFNIYAPALDQNDPDQYSRQVALMLTHIYNVQITPTTTMDEIIKLGT